MKNVKHITSAFVLGLGLLGLAACDPAPEPETKEDTAAEEEVKEEAQEDATEEVAEALDPRVETASKVAAAIEADPQNADSILENAGLDRDGLNDLMYEIARDPGLSASYQEQRAAG